jgi:serine/threonine protein kinase/tetratricopeptide (TPR) repeat protein
MGEVYRARDSKLNRDVALKILPEGSAADPERLARFKREAQVLASLNHPHVGSIYGFEDSERTHALVLELVEGKTLAERIADGRLPINEALSIARQIAEAIEAASQQGVIHRDLKPANIKLRPDGTVKVLDFGLAKLAQRSDSEFQISDVSQLPTVMNPAATGRGAIMGTAAYMSPEQARGLPVDRQTDIWAFGCVLYEMLSGRPAFAGETFSDTIVRILEREPDWQQLPASTPAKVRDLLRRCLQKTQQRRLHDVADARIEIEDTYIGLKAPRRMVTLQVLVAGLVLSLALVAGVWWYARRSIPPVQHEPVSILIADFQNRTNDPTFDRTLEPLLRIVLEGAAFISAYDRTVVNRSLGVQPPDMLDESAAREFAVRQGVNVVLSGSLERQGSGYVLSVRAVQSVTGTVISSVQGTAADKDRVLPEATRLVTDVREALGDDTSDAARRFAMETLSATSLDVVRDYATAMDALSNNKTDVALESFAKAVNRDPRFGLAHAGMAIAAFNLDKRQDAEKHAREAVRHLERMTERERFRTRGLFYLVTNDYQQCVKEYGDLVDRYVADAGARNNLALCSTYLRDMPTALDQMRRAVAILPKRPLYRLNLALYAAYAGDFKTAEQEARETEKLGGALAMLPMAFAQLGQGQLAPATDFYQQLAKVNPQGAFYAASGLADLAVYECRFSDAVRILEESAAASVKSNNSDRAASHFAALAQVKVLRRENSAALASIESALANSRAVKIRFLTARALVDMGDIARARTLAAGLASELQVESQAYSRILEGEVALKMGEPREAIKAFVEANTLVDSWLGHFNLGRAYLEAGAFIQADSEFDRCIKRRGEALSLFLDEQATYGVMPSVYYYQGLVREGLKADGFAESYRIYLSIRGQSKEDVLVAEIRRRLRQ